MLIASLFSPDSISNEASRRLAPGIIARYCEELFINRNGFLVFALFQVDGRQHVKAFDRLRLIFQPQEKIFGSLFRIADSVVIFGDFPVTVVDTVERL